MLSSRLGLGVEILPKPGDIPRMVTLKADDRGRVKLPGVEPGKVFSFSTEADGSFRLAEVVEKSVPVVNPVKRRDGSYKWPVKLTRDEFNSMMRAAKESK